MRSTADQESTSPRCTSVDPDTVRAEALLSDRAPTDPTEGDANGPCASLRTRPRARSALADLPVEQMEAEAVELSERMGAGTYELLVLIGELDAQCLWAERGALSCAAWLAERCGAEVSTTRSQVRVARAMIRFPQLDAAMARGDISYTKARVLVAYLNEANEAALVDLAEQNPASRLGAAIAAWSQRNEDPSTITDRQHEARSLSWRTEPDGTVLVVARLEPAVAGEVCAVIDLATARTNAPAGATLAQQRADALAFVLTSGGGGAQAEVVVHVTAEGNRLADGTPLSDHAVTRMLPDAFVSLLLLDAQRQPIDASPRRRSPTRRQRRVLDERDVECQYPGCTARVFLQYDHIDPYAAGGRTVIDNLRRLCGPHNRSRWTA